jgi:hypothetical protein
MRTSVAKIQRHLLPDTQGQIAAKKSLQPLTRIKVQLDYETVVVLNRLSSLKIWKQRYPDAAIIR